MKQHKESRGSSPRPYTPLAFGLACTVGLAPCLGEAQSPVELSPVVVTATRTAVTVDESLAAVSVVTREDIERNQAQSVPDILRTLPGVSISTNGGRGKTASVNVRGTNPDQVLVLIDGIRVGSATFGTTPFQDLPIDLIDRIEVVRGPRSSLYGSEAIGGVIQIFTRRGGGKTGARASVGAGTYNTINASVGLSGGGAGGWYDLSGSLEETEGFNACTGRPSPRAGCGVIQNDRDGYASRSFSLRGGYDWGERASVDVHWLRSDNENEFDGSPRTFGNEERSRQQVLGARLEVMPTDFWDLSLSGGRSWDKSRIYFDGDFKDRFDTMRDSLSLQNDLRFGPHRLTAGVDYQLDQVDGTTEYGEDSRDNTGIFGEYLVRWGDADFKFGLRHDDNEQFGGQTTGSIAAGYDLPFGVRAFAAYGTAYRAPTFNELYFPPSLFGTGNPDLEPEQSKSIELGLSGRLAAVDWGLNAYYTDIDDLILFSEDFIPKNVDSALIRGLEMSASTRIYAWDVKATVDLVDPENRSSGANRGNTLPRRARETATLDLDRQFGKARVGASLFISGRRFNDEENDVSLDGFGLLDLRAEYALSDSIRVQGRIENLFDEEYETVDFYKQSGRAFYFTMRYQPKR